MRKETLKNCFKVEKEFTDEELRENLSNLYDVVNEIAATLTKEETKDWFYTDEQIEKMKKDPKYRFI